MSSRLHEDCGGSRFLDLGGLFMVAPLALVTSVLSSAPADLDGLWRWTVVNLGALAVTVLPVAAARMSVAHAKHLPVHFGVTVLVGAVIGAVKGIATSALASSLGLVGSVGSDMVGRTLNTAIIGAVVVPALAAVMAAHDRWQTERDLLMVELVRRALDTHDISEAPYRRRLHDVVTHAQLRLDTLEPAAVAHELRHLVDHELRPLSNEVLAAAAAPPPLSRGWHLVRVAMTEEPWPIVTVASLFAAATWLLLGRHVGVVDATTMTLALGTGTAVVLLVGSMLRRRWPSSSPVVVLGTLVVVAVGQRPLGDVIMGPVDSLDHVGVSIITALWLAQLIVVSTVINVTRRERDAIRDQLLKLLGPRGIGDAIGHGVRAIDGREFAFFVHGQLQNQLIAEARRLELGDATPTDTVERVRELFDEATTPPPGTSLAARLDEVTQRWHGLVDVDISRTRDIADLSPDMVDRVVHVVVEAVTNAVRHAAATRVQVDIACHHTGAVTVEVTDDGFGPRRGKPGTGSRYLDVVAPGSWTLTAAPSPGGSRLSATLPCAVS